MGQAQWQRVEDGVEIVVHVAAEICGVVGIDRHEQAGVEQLHQVMVMHLVEDAQLGVRQGADGQRDLFARQAGRQVRVFQAAHAMVDAFDSQVVERRADVGWRTFLARVGHQVQAQLAATGKHARKFLGRVAHFRGIEADADEFVAVRQRVFQGLERFFLAQVTQETQDQGRADGAVLAGAMDAVDHIGDGHAARRVRLRVEEDFRVQHVIGFGAAQVGLRHVIEILLFQEHACASVINVEKRL